MTKIVGVRFQRAGKIYYFDPADYDLDMAMHVVVETARGMEMGTVLIPPKEVDDDTIVTPLKPVIRVATDEDEQMMEYNKSREKEAFAICKKKILEHELEMKLVSVEYTFDGSKLLFYFTADGRIDFRELVKDLASVFRTRIELRQIGVRDETKMMGGIGICGRPLCCSSWLSDFVPVSIKMAKEQNLSLNPSKISGVCGRLMCCLKNEQETYEYLNSQLPNTGDIVTLSDGTKGQVNAVNVLRQTVKILVDNGEEKELKEYPVKEITNRPHHRKESRITDEEMKAVENLESMEEADNKQERETGRNRAERKPRDRRRPSDDRENTGDSQQNREDRENRSNNEDREPREDRGNREDRRPREDRGNREDRGPREDRDNRGKREDRGNREDRGSREDRGNREDRRPREDRGNREDRRPREDRGNREDRGPREDRGNREDRRPREDRGNREPRINRENREERGPREDRGTREDRRNRMNREERGNRRRFTEPDNSAEESSSESSGQPEA